jgi:hypothetical protein
MEHASVCVSFLSQEGDDVIAQTPDGRTLRLPKILFPEDANVGDVFCFRRSNNAEDAKTTLNELLKSD